MRRRRVALALATATVLVAGACESSASPASPARPSAASSAASAVSPSSSVSSVATPGPAVPFEVEEFDVPPGSHPHDVAPAADGGVWYTAQLTGRLGHLDPDTGAVTEIPLGDASRPHGVIVGPDGAPWITDGGLNAIVRVEPATQAIDGYPLPPEFPAANLNTATFDGDGVLWFTGQAGMYGRLDPDVGKVEAFAAPRGQGPYGIATTPDGEVWFSSLAGSYLGRIDRATGEATAIEPPTPGAGARRVWSDPQGRLLISEWNAGQVGRYDPADGSWREWPIPGDRRAQAYAIYVDETGIAWVTDFGNDTIWRFDPATEAFTEVPVPTDNAAVRQLLGRQGEVWGAESATDKLLVIRTEA